MSQMTLIFVVLLTVCAVMAVPTNSRIMGGEDVSPANSIPHMVSIQFKADAYHVCGGTLLMSSRVLTSASCCSSFPFLDEMRVVAGEHDLAAVDGANEQYRDVARVTVHEDYDAFNLVNDICIVVLSADFDTSQPAVATVSLPIQDFEFSGIGTVSGWGTIAVGGPISNILQAVELPIVTDADCRKVYGEDVIKDNMLCAGGVDGEDSCERDSGSPMTCRQEGAQSDNLCGLASYGLSCGLQGVPGVYTQVSHFIGWIQDNQE